MLSDKISIRFSSIGILVLILVGFALTTPAQSTGGVKGKIRDMAGRRIVGATVTARQNSEDVRSVRSNDKGEFQIGGLDAGTYNIVFDAKGYASGIKYGVEVKGNKTVDLGDRLIMLVDRGTQVIIRGSVFFKDGTSITGAKVLIEKVQDDGSVRKIGTVITNFRGEFSYTRPEGPAKYRVTAMYKDSKASKDIEVDSAAIYGLAISLDITR
jgi:hypothetical protein